MLPDDNFKVSRKIEHKPGIEFYNDENEWDKTLFGVNPCYLDYYNGKCRELEELWIEFCKENGFRQNSIIQISFAFP